MGAQVPRDPPVSTSKAQLPVPGAARHSRLGLYVVLAYGLSWAWLLPLALTGSTIEPGRGWPTHFPALLGPMVAALLVAARAGELRGLVSRMVRVRVGPGWWLVALSPLGLCCSACSPPG